MNILIGVCVAILTVAVLLLLYAVFRTLKLASAAIEEAKRAIGELREETKLTIGELREEVLQVSQEARTVVHNTNAVTLDAREKMKELDALFGTAREIGQAAHALASAVRQTAVGAVAKVKRAGRIAESAARQADTARQAKTQGDRDVNGAIAAIADGIASSIRIWNRLKQP